MTKAKKTSRQMHVFKVVSRVKVQGERRYPYRVLGLPMDADLMVLAGAILDAFSFDDDHAFGFFDGKNPYRSNVRYELLSDMEGSRGLLPPGSFLPGLPSTVPELPEPPSEADLALMLLLEVVDRRALLRETAGFLTRRLEEEVLPRVPERLREGVGESLKSFASEMLTVDDPEEDFSLPLPPGVREMLEQPGGLEQVLGRMQLVAPALAGPGLPSGLLGPQREEYGVKGVPVTEPFERQEKWTFLFDYGDDWMFDVTYQGVQDAPPRVRLPHVLETLGTVPEQYPEWEE